MYDMHVWHMYGMLDMQLWHTLVTCLHILYVWHIHVAFMAHSFDACMHACMAHIYLCMYSIGIY